MRTLILAIILAVSPLGFTGCVHPRTHQAVVFDSFKTTYNAAYSAYTGYLELVVKGKVSKANELKADKAWNDFRAGFSIAFKAASQDWNAAAPENVRALSETLINVIRSL